MEFEEYEFDIVWSHQKQSWVQTLKNGRYLVNVKATGFKEVNEMIEVSSFSEKNYKFILKTLNENQIRLSVSIIDLFTCKPIKNTFIELWKESFQQPDESVTDENGDAQYIVRNFGTHYIRVSKAGYVPYEQQICFSKGYVEPLQNQVSIQVCLLKANPSQMNDGYIVLNCNNGLVRGILMIQDDSGKSVKVDVDEKTARQFCKVDLGLFKDFDIEGSPSRAESKERNKFLNVSVDLVAQNVEKALYEPTLDRTFSN